MPITFKPGRTGKILPSYLCSPEYDTHWPRYFVPFYIDISEHKYEPLHHTHWHPGVELNVVLSGSGQYYRDGLYYDIAAGDCSFTNPMVPHMGGSYARSEIAVLYLHMSVEAIRNIPPPELNREVLKLFLWPPPTHTMTPVLADQKRIVDLLVRAKEAYHSTGRFQKMVAWAHIVEAIAVLADQLSPIINENTSLSERRNYQKIMESVEYIHQHSAENIAVDEIAAKHALSPTHYTRLFRTIMQSSPIEYRNLLRINRARELVVTTEDKIETIANDCGFESPAAFYRLFRKITGESPNYFRKKTGE